MKLRIRKELWFGFILMAAILIPTFIFLPAPWNMTGGHLGLLMLCLVVVAIMLGFPTAFTLMGMGVLFAFLAYRFQAPVPEAWRQTLMLMVQRTYAVMTNDVLISVPLFVFMGYLVERAALIEKLFKSLHLAIGRIPGSLAVATLVTCAVFATATGIIGAVVTLMGLLALARHAPGPLRRQAVGGRHHRRRDARHPHPAVGAPHPLRRHRQRLGGAALRRRLLPRPHAGQPLRRLRHPPGLAEPEPRAQASAGGVRSSTFRSGPRSCPAARKRLAIPAMVAALRGGHPGISTGKLLGQIGIGLLPARHGARPRAVPLRRLHHRDRDRHRRPRGGRRGGRALRLRGRQGSPSPPGRDSRPPRAAEEEAPPPRRRPSGARSRGDPGGPRGRAHPPRECPLPAGSGAWWRSGSPSSS